MPRSIIEGNFSDTGNLSIKTNAFNDNHILSPNVATAVMDLSISPTISLFSKTVQNSPPEQIHRSMPNLTEEITCADYINTIINKTKDEIVAWIPLNLAYQKVWETILIGSINQYRISPSSNTFNQTTKIAAVVMGFYSHSKKKHTNSGVEQYSQDKISEQLLYEVSQKEIFTKPFPLIVFFTNKIFLDYFNKDLSDANTSFEWVPIIQMLLTHHTILRTTIF